MPRPATGADPSELSLVREPEPREPGLEVVSILVMLNASLSSMGLLPKEEEGDGSGWDTKMDSERGVWFPPRPLEGGTPMRRDGGDVVLAEAIISA